MPDVFALARYFPQDGSLDSGFGPDHDGRVTTDLASALPLPSRPLPTSSPPFAVDSSDRLVTRVGNQLVRYLRNGDPDTSFGDGDTSFGDGGREVPDIRMVLDSADRILSAGLIRTPAENGAPGRHVALARYTSAGLLDGTFGDRGIAIDRGAAVDMNESAFDTVAGVALDRRDRILIGGRGRLARYTPNGALDTTFGNDGRVTYSRLKESRYFGFGLGIVVDSQGGIVLCGERFSTAGGQTAARVSMLRFRSNGAADLSFGAEGRAELNFGSDAEHQDVFMDIAIDSADRLLVCATIRQSLDLPGRGSRDLAGIARLTRDGKLDPGFAGDGRTRLSFGDESTYLAYGIALDSRERLVVVGTEYGRDDRLALARYRSDGGLDPEFGGNGRVVTTSAFADNLRSSALAVDGRDGLYVAANAEVSDRFVPPDRLGRGRSLPVLVHYLGDGSLDASFGHAGKLPSELYFPDKSRVEALAIDGGDRIVAGGSVRVRRGRGLRGFALVRYHADGRVDDRFGDGGRVILPEHAPTAGMAVDGVDRILVGSHTPGEGSRFILTRHQPNGQPDASFGVGGTVVTDFRSTPAEQIRAVALTRENKVVVGGSARTASSSNQSNQFALARYLPDGTLDRGFGGDGKVLTDLPFSESVSLLAVDGLDRVVVGGFAQVTPGTGGEFILARYTPTGELDGGFGVDGTALTGLRHGAGDRIHALTLDASDRILLGGRTGPRFAVARFLSDGSPDSTFGVAGRVSTALPGLPPDAGVRAIAVDTLGRIVAAGFVVRTISEDVVIDPTGTAVTQERSDRSLFAVLRYLPNGQLDPSLGDDGIVRTAFGSSDPMFPAASAGIHALGLDRADRIVVAGYATTSG